MGKDKTTTKMVLYKFSIYITTIESTTGKFIRMIKSDINRTYLIMLLRSHTIYTRMTKADYKVRCSIVILI